MPIKHLLLVLLTIFAALTGCGSAPDTTGKPATASNVPTFRISAARAVSDQSPKTNWCLAEFGESVVVGADPMNTNRRVFFLPPGVTWLAVRDGNTRANLLLRPLENGDVEVFTGTNFPYCLSRPEFVRPAANDPARLRYYNEANIDVVLELLSEQGHPKVALDFQPGTFYALEVVRCGTCE